MTNGRAATAAVVEGFPGGAVDWRIARLASLMARGWLDGEWDADRQLVLPVPGGRLTRVQRCVVSGCPSDAHGASPLCARHRRQFATSKITDLGSWVQSSEADRFERRHCVDSGCAVTGVDGRGCPRSAQGRWRLCSAHTAAWAHRRARHIPFETFLAGAEPLDDLGGCVAACCYLGVVHRHSGLCEVHFRLWREDGTATMEFVLMVPVFLTIFMASFESSLLMVRQILLDQSVDQSMRPLGASQTSTVPSHESVAI